MADIPQDAIEEALAFKRAMDRLLAAPFGTTAMAVVALTHMVKDKGAASALLREMADQIDPPLLPAATAYLFNDFGAAQAQAVARENWAEAERKVAETHHMGQPT